MLLAGLLSLCALTVSLIQLYTASRISFLPPLESVIPSTIASQGSGSGSKVRGESDNIFTTIRAYREAQDLPLSPRSTDYSSAQLLYRLGLRENNAERRIQLFCASLSELTKAVQRHPFDPRLLISWANIRQLLANVECRIGGASQPTANDNYNDVVDYAITLDPTNARVIYEGAQMSVWAGQLDRAIMYMRRFLEISTSISDAERSFIGEHINSPELMQAILPAQFPQIAEWSVFFYRRNRNLFERSSEKLAALQQKALDRNRDDYERGIIPPSLYMKRLSDLVSYCAHSDVRQRIDSELARVYSLEGRESLRRYLESRSRLENVPVLESVIRADTRPQRSPLTIWGEPDRIPLDNFYTSVGIYVPAGSVVKYLELRGGIDAPLLNPVVIKVFESDNNLVWKPLAAQASLESMEIFGLPHLVISLGDVRKRYIKVHYASAAKESRFVNNLSDMVRAYGKSANP